MNTIRGWPKARVQLASSLSNSEIRLCVHQRPPVNRLTALVRAVERHEEYDREEDECHRDHGGVRCQSSEFGEA
jgi:hypothetical protein